MEPRAQDGPLLPQDETPSRVRVVLTPKPCEVEDLVLTVFKASGAEAQKAASSPEALDSFLYLNRTKAAADAIKFTVDVDTLNLGVFARAGGFKMFKG